MSDRINGSGVELRGIDADLDDLRPRKRVNGQRRKGGDCLFQSDTDGPDGRAPGAHRRIVARDIRERGFLGNLQGLVEVDEYADRIGIGNRSLIVVLGIGECLLDGLSRNGTPPPSRFPVPSNVVLESYGLRDVMDATKRGLRITPTAPNVFTCAGQTSEQLSSRLSLAQMRVAVRRSSGNNEPSGPTSPFPGRERWTMSARRCFKSSISSSSVITPPNWPGISPRSACSFMELNALSGQETIEWPSMNATPHLKRLISFLLRRCPLRVRDLRYFGVQYDTGL